MANFDYMEFIGGYSSEMVFHASKFSEAEALSIARGELEEFEEADLVAVKRYVRYYPKTPEWLRYELGDNGCYSYCKQGERGSFPVWVVRHKEVIGNE